MLSHRKSSSAVIAQLKWTLTGNQRRLPEGRLLVPRGLHPLHPARTISGESVGLWRRRRATATKPLRATTRPTRRDLVQVKGRHGLLFKSKACWQQAASTLVTLNCCSNFRRVAAAADAPGLEVHRKPPSDPEGPRRRLALGQRESRRWRRYSPWQSSSGWRLCLH
jgi:hypothetical protein